MRLSFFIAILLFTYSCLVFAQTDPLDKKHTNISSTNAFFRNNEASLKAHNAAPEWFQDAKLGIYFHWGVYTVPAYETEHYIREMHKPESKVGKHHRQKYGPPTEFAYHDFIPQFTAEKFNAEEWAQLIFDAGAKFSGPVTEHHDGFAMWDSKLTPWNAADMGPKRDVLGEYSKAIRAKGLKLITTFHIGRHLGKGHIPRVPGYPSSTTDSKLKQLYYSDMSDEQIMDIWTAKVNEVVSNYQPDILWFDSWLHALSPNRKFSMLANFFNQAKNNNQEVVVAFKQDDLSTDIGVVDIEKGRMRDLQKRPWLTDDSIAWGWSFIDRTRAKPFKRVLHSFVDTVSKNGIVLLNITPKSNGTIPEDQRALLVDVGNWLRRYGEAVYATRPWLVYGIGPGDNKVERNIHGGIKGSDYSWQDLRFTQTETAIYIHQMGKAPAGHQHVIKVFNQEVREIRKITLLNTSQRLAWSKGPRGLIVTVPNTQPDDLVNVYKVQLK